MHSFDLEGKVAVVTGGGQGIGEGIAKAYAESGAAVLVAARHEDRIGRVAEEIVAAGGRSLAVDDPRVRIVDPVDHVDRAVDGIDRQRGVQFVGCRIGDHERRQPALHR